MSSKSLPIDEIVQTIVIKLQHSQLGNLIHDDAHHFFLSKLYLKHVADLLQVIEPRRPSVICGPQAGPLGIPPLSPRLAFRSTVSQQLEHLCEEGFVWIFVSSAPVLGHFVHEPGEDFLSPVVDGSMNRCDLKTMIEIPS